MGASPVSLWHGSVYQILQYKLKQYTRDEGFAFPLLSFSKVFSSHTQQRVKDCAILYGPTLFSRKC